MSTTAAYPSRPFNRSMASPTTIERNPFFPPYSDLTREEVELARLDASPSSPPSSPFTSMTTASTLHDDNLLSTATTTTTTTNTAAPEAAGTTTRQFTPTVQLQVQNRGMGLGALPLPPRPDPIPVYAVTPGGSLGGVRYASLRPKRKSGSCYLVSAGGRWGMDGGRRLSTTAYRWGPGRPPRVRLFSEGDENEDDGNAAAADDNDGDDGQEDGGGRSWDDFEVCRRGPLTRTQTFRTRLGTFEWRYASRKERKAIASASGGGGSAEVANNILVLERVVRVFRSLLNGDRINKKNKSGGGEEEVRTTVAILVRSDELRSPGSTRGSAGNGGRLLVDLGLWTGGAGAGASGEKEEEVDREMALVMVITTCLVMLKKEIDRRRR